MIAAAKALLRMPQVSNFELKFDMSNVPFGLHYLKAFENEDEQGETINFPALYIDRIDRKEWEPSQALLALWQRIVGDTGEVRHVFDCYSWGGPRWPPASW